MMVQTPMVMSHIDSESSTTSPHESVLDPHGRSTSSSSPTTSITSPPAPAPRSPETKPPQSSLPPPTPLPTTPATAIYPDVHYSETESADVDFQRARSRALLRSVHEREAENEGGRRRRTPPKQSIIGDVVGQVGREIDIDVDATLGGGLGGDNDEDEDHVGVNDVARGFLTGTSWRTTSKTTSGRPSSAQLRRNGSALSSPSIGMMLSMEPILVPVLATSPSTPSIVSMVVERPCRPLPNRPKLVRRPPHVGIKERFNEMDGSQ